MLKVLKIMASKKSLRSGQSMFNDDKKTGSTENTNISKKDAEKNFEKEDEEKKKTIDWKKERNILEKYLSEEYSLSPKKIDKIIKEKAEKYINYEKYQKYFLKYQSKRVNNKLSNASKEIRQFFDEEAKESNGDSSSEEDENDDVVGDNESEKSQSDIDEDEEDNLNTNVRKRKCEFSTLDDSSSSPKKKDTPVLKWLPNGNKVSF